MNQRNLAVYADMAVDTPKMGFHGILTEVKLIGDPRGKRFVVKRCPMGSPAGLQTDDLVQPAKKNLH